MHEYPFFLDIFVIPYIMPIFSKVNALLALPLLQKNTTCEKMKMNARVTLIKKSEIVLCNLASTQN